MKELGSDNASVRRFVGAASEYCRVLEVDEFRSQGEFIRRVLASLLPLYSAALELPDIEPESDATAERRIERNDRAKFCQHLIRKLGGELPYRKVFEPFDTEDRDVVVASLADDLSDIYFDIKPGLLNVDNFADASVYAVWNWRFGC